MEPHDDTHTTSSEEKSTKGSGKARWVEQIEVSGNQLVDRVKELLQDSETKRVIIKTQDGREMLSVPLTFGVAIGGIVTLGAPLLAALGAVAALTSRAKLEVIREEGAETEIVQDADTKPDA